jgi:hypothetical protein
MSILPRSNIRVDNFEFMKNDLTQYVFFLSHCHEGKRLSVSSPSLDHVKGLTPSWNFGKIYTSSISKKLICEKYPHLKDLTVCLRF